MKAAVDTNDPPTVQDIANGYQDRLKSNLLLDEQNGDVLASVGATSRSTLVVASQPAVRRALAGRESFSLLPQPDGVLQFATVPIATGLTQPVFWHAERRLPARQRRRRAVEGRHGSYIAFGMNGRAGRYAARRTTLFWRGEFHATSASRVSPSQDYVARHDPCWQQAAQLTGAVALILRSRTEQFRFRKPSESPASPRRWRRRGDALQLRRRTDHYAPGYYGRAREVAATDLTKRS